MRLTIEGPDGVILAFGGSPNALLPCEDGERSQAFEALTGALALLVGVKPLVTSDAKEVGTDEHSAANGQRQSDRSCGNVVPLASRRDSQAPSPMRG